MKAPQTRVAGQLPGEKEGGDDPRKKRCTLPSGGPARDLDLHNTLAREKGV